ncbi:methyltransferase domain-containing protein [Citrobacter braakii]|uniref:methyltransferase domain-containing protein n=1 Tax=Citrobacter braakii TaxID=57706 RepID=UPI0035A08CDB|nr:methyltransferase domain-containing protein [Escherichia coli]
MNTSLDELIAKLPEKYQTIFGHPKWDDEVSRDCNARLPFIEKYYENLSSCLGRPLRVLDLGCAQGFFSLNLASKGAEVHGLDFLAENIDVCRALADENPAFKAEFSVGKIEEFIEEIKPGQYDMAIGLSVFHHLVHALGLEKVKALLERLANVTEAFIVELALQEEPLYWGPSLPEDPTELIQQCAFYKLIARFDTHLSNISRPMYIVSNKRLILGEFNQPFESWRSRPHAAAGFPHQNTRRYYFGENYIAKLYQLPQGRVHLQNQTVRNRKELQNAHDFLTKPAVGIAVPQVLSFCIDEEDGWLVTSILPGMLLNDFLASKNKINVDELIASILKQLTALEKQKLYHDDLRTWNILYDQETNKYHLIDYGSISHDKKDCDWPFNVFQAFFIFINDILLPQYNKDAFWWSSGINPFSLPKEYANWLCAVWQQPVSKLSFELISSFFNDKAQLPDFEARITSLDLWVRAQENAILESQSRILGSNGDIKYIHDLLNEIQLNIHNLSERNDKLHDLHDKQNEVIDSIVNRVDRLTADSERINKLNDIYDKQNEVIDSIVNRVDRLTADHESSSNNSTKINEQMNGHIKEVIEELNLRRTEIENMQRLYALSQENLHNVYNSNSWKITAPLRKAKSFSSRAKSFLMRKSKGAIKKCLLKGAAWVKKDNKRKTLIIKVLKATGLFERSRSFYLTRLNTSVINEQIINEMNHGQHNNTSFSIHNDAYNEPILLSPHGKKILMMLKKDVK